MHLDIRMVSIFWILLHAPCFEEPIVERLLAMTAASSGTFAHITESVAGV
jgi:hypothetical protein